MSTKRRVIDRGKGGRLTPDIIAAWHACDFSALHLLLHLKPWDSSPLPKEIAGLGVSQDDLSDFDPNTASPADQSLPKIVAIQAELLAVAGWPSGARAAYEENLREAEKDFAYARDRYKNPPLGEYGTGTSPEERRQHMIDCEEKVEYRRELLADLPRMQKKWVPRTKALAPE